MNESLEFTPKEKYLISLWKDPSALIRKTIDRRLMFLIPSLILAVHFIWTADYLSGFLAYAILVYQAIRAMVVVRGGLRSINSIINKYEARLKKQSETQIPST